MARPYCIENDTGNAWEADKNYKESYVDGQLYLWNYQRIVHTIFYNRRVMMMIIPTSSTIFYAAIKIKKWYYSVFTNMIIKFKKKQNSYHFCRLLKRYINGNIVVQSYHFCHLLERLQKGTNLLMKFQEEEKYCHICFLQ